MTIELEFHKGDIVFYTSNTKGNNKWVGIVTDSRMCGSDRLIEHYVQWYTEGLIHGSPAWIPAYQMEKIGRVSPYNDERVEVIYASA